jgi:rod shape-determining protein MreC
MSPKLTRRVLIGLVLIILIVFSDRWIFKGAIEGTLRRAAEIVTRPATACARYFDRFFVSHFQTSQLYFENEKLKQELNSNISSAAQFEILERENDLLKKQLGISPKKKQELVEARIVGILRNGIISEVLINQGVNAGLKKGMTVLGGGVVAGLIVEVSNDWSRVRLLDDSRSAVSIRFVGGNTLAIAKGRSNDTLSIELVGVQEKVAKDARIVTSGYDGFPEGLVVGTVDIVGTNGSNLFRAITARTVFDITASPYVDVLLE